MDIKQDEITTLHDLKVEKKKLMKSVADASEDRPVSVIMPVSYTHLRAHET